MWPLVGLKDLLPPNITMHLQTCHQLVYRILTRPNCDIAKNTSFCKGAGQPFPKKCLPAIFGKYWKRTEFEDEKWFCSGLATSRKSTLKTDFNLNLSTFTWKNPQR